MDKDNLSVQQKQLIAQYKQAYPQLKNLSDEQILSVLNESLNEVTVKENEAISAFWNENLNENNDDINLSQKPLTEQEKEQLEENIDKRLNDLSVKIKSAEDNNGWIGKTWSWFKNTLNIGDSSNKVRKYREKELELLKQDNLEQNFKEITGVDYTPENVRNFLNGEIKTLSEQALDGYIEGQDMTKDVVGDLASGIASMLAYSAAIALAPVTGGASIAVGFGFAAVVGAGVKAGIKATDGTSKENIVYDLATGAFSGILAPITGGTGGAVAKTFAAKMGMQVVKQGTKEVVEAGVKTTIKQGIKTALTNPTGYEYIGGSFIKKVGSYGIEMAVDGALGGGIDNAFRAGIDGDENTGIGEAAIQGTIGGLFMAPMMGGAFKGIGYVNGKIFSHNSKLFSNVPTEKLIAEFNQASSDPSILTKDGQKHFNELVSELEARGMYKDGKLIDNGTIPKAESDLNPEPKFEPMPEADVEPEEPHKVADVQLSDGDSDIQQKATVAETTPKAEADVAPEEPHKVADVQPSDGDSDIQQKATVAETTPKAEADVEPEEPHKVADVQPSDGDSDIQQKATVAETTPKTEADVAPEEPHKVADPKVTEDNISVQEKTPIVGKKNYSLELKRALNGKILNNNQFTKLLNIINEAPQDAELILESLRHPQSIYAISEILDNMYKNVDDKEKITAFLKILSAKHPHYTGIDPDIAKKLLKEDVKSLNITYQIISNVKDSNGNATLYNQITKIMAANIQEENVPAIIRLINKIGTQSLDTKELSDLASADAKKLMALEQFADLITKIDKMYEHKHLYDYLELEPERIDFCEKLTKFNINTDKILDALKSTKINKESEEKILDLLKDDLFAKSTNHSGRFSKYSENIYENLQKILEYTDEELDACYRILKLKDGFGNFSYSYTDLKNLDEELLPYIAKLATLTDNNECVLYSSDIKLLMCETPETIKLITENFMKQWVPGSDAQALLDKLRFLSPKVLKDPNYKLSAQEQETENVFAKFINESCVNYSLSKIRQLCTNTSGELEPEALKMLRVLGGYNEEAELKEVFDLFRKVDGNIDFDKFNRVNEKLADILTKWNPIHTSEKKSLYKIGAKYEDKLSEITPQLLKYRKQLPILANVNTDINKLIELITENMDLLKLIKSPELIDENGYIFDIIASYKKLQFEDWNIHSLTDELTAAPTKMHVECMEEIIKQLDACHESKMYSWELTNLLLNLTEDKLNILKLITKNYNYPNSNNPINVNSICSLLNASQSKEDIELVALLAEKCKLPLYKYDKDFSINSYGIDAIKHSPKLRTWLLNNKDVNIDVLLEEYYSLNQINKIFPTTDAKLNDFISKLSSNPSEEGREITRKLFENLNNLLKPLSEIPEEKQDIVMELLLKQAKKHQSINDSFINVLNTIKNIDLKDIEKFNKFADKIDSRDLKYLPAIINAEKTYDKQAYQKLVKLIGDENSGLNVQSIRKILQAPYNKEKFDYIMAHVDDSNEFFSISSIANYLMLENSSIDDFDIMQNQSDILFIVIKSERDAFEELNKYGLNLINLVVNDIKLNGKCKYDTNEVLLVLDGSQLKGDINIELLRKLYNYTDQNGKPILPIATVLEASKKQDIALKLLNESPNAIPKLDLENITATPKEIEEFINEVPNIYKFLLLDSEGQISPEEYINLIKKLNDNEFLRDALVDYKETGKIHLNNISNEDIGLLMLTESKKENLNLLKILLEISENDMDTAMQKLKDVEYIVNLFCENEKKYVETHLGMLPKGVNIDDYISILKKDYCNDNLRILEIASTLDVIGKDRLTKIIGDSSELESRDRKNTLLMATKYICSSSYANDYKQLFNSINLDDTDFEAIISIAGLSQPDNYYRKIDTKLNEAEFVETIRKIIKQKHFDNIEFLEEVYKNISEANPGDFKPISREQFQIIAKYNLAASDNIEPKYWAEFVEMSSGMQEIIIKLSQKKINFVDVKRIIEISNEEIDKMSFNDKLKLVKVIDKIDDEDIAIIEKNGYAIKDKIAKIAKTLVVEKTHIKTDKTKQAKFLRHFLGNNNKQSENILKTCDFDSKIFADGIPLKYSRKAFIEDIEGITAGLSKENVELLYKYFGITQGFDGFEGIPVVPENSEIALTGELQAKANQMAEKIINFTTKNETTIKDKNQKEFFDAIIQGLPEFTTIIGKGQHGTHKYTVDIHTFKVIQEIMNAPGYEKLSDQGKFAVKFAALVHDFGKKGKTVDHGHEILSAEYINGILDKLQIPESLRFRIIDIVANHHWFEHYNKGEMSAQTIAAMCRNPEDFEIYKIFAKADLLGVNEDFYKSVTGVKDISELDELLAEKFSYIEKELEFIPKHANLVYDTKITASKLPVVKRMLHGIEEEFRVLNLANLSADEDLTQYGFFNMSREDLRFITHMPTNNIQDLYTKMKIFRFLSYSPTEQSVQSTSLTMKTDARSYGGRMFGFILDVNQDNISTATFENQGSGTHKNFQRFVDLLFNKNKNPFVKKEFVTVAKNLGYEISDEEYELISKYLYNKKHITAIYNEFVNMQVNPNDIINNGKSGFTKELYAEYISPKTTVERKAEIFEKCVKSKTFVFKKDGSVEIEYASKIGDIVPNDGEFRIKATDLRTILEKSRDKLTRGSSHSEIVALRPRIQGLVAKVDSLDECPDDFLQFAKEYNLPIILMGNTNL